MTFWMNTGRTKIREAILDIQLKRQRLAFEHQRSFGRTAQPDQHARAVLKRMIRA
jgi:hypothetical protein